MACRQFSASYSPLLSMDFSCSVGGPVNGKHWQTGSFCSAFVFETKSLVSQAGFELIAKDDFELLTLSFLLPVDYRHEPPHPVHVVVVPELRASNRSTLGEH